MFWGIKVEEYKKPKPQLKKLLFKEKDYKVNLYTQDNFFLFIHQKVIEKIFESCKGKENEQGGVFIGKYCADKQEEVEFIMIEDLILMKEGKSSAFFVEFSSKDWQEVEKYIKGMYPRKLLVGWFHSHPALGLFLSQKDIFIHKSFFNESWQVACVFDSKQETLAFFKLNDKEQIIQLSSFFVYSQKRSKKKTIDLKNYFIFLPR